MEMFMHTNPASSYRKKCQPCSLDCDDGVDEDDDDADIETFTFPSVVPRIGQIHDNRGTSKTNRDSNKTPATSRVGGPFSKIGNLHMRRERSAVVSARVLCIEVCVQ